MVWKEAVTKFHAIKISRGQNLQVQVRKQRRQYNHPLLVPSFLIPLALLLSVANTEILPFYYLLHLSLREKLSTQGWDKGINPFKGRKSGCSCALVFLNVSLKPSVILEKCLLLLCPYVELLRLEHCNWLIFIQFCCQVLLLVAST